MPGSDTLAFNPTLEAAVAAAFVGFAAFWSNPKRSVNRAFFSASLHVAAWLGLLHIAVTTPNGLVWVRATSSIGALFPIQLWLIKDSITDTSGELLRHLWRRRLWVLVMIIVAIIPATEWFIPNASLSTPANAHLFGTGYYVYIGALVALYLAQARDTVRDMRAQRGISRLELQNVLLGGCSAAVAILTLMALRAAFGIPWLVRLQPLAILVFYTAMVVAVTTHRIFDARHLFLIGLQWVTTVGTVASAAFILELFFSHFFPDPFAWLATTAVALWIAATLKSWLDRVLHFYPQATQAREAAYTAARASIRIDKLEHEFVSVLKGWGQCEHALILSGAKGLTGGAGVELSIDSPIVAVLRQLRWATPERLDRERSSAPREALSRFLRENRLGITAIVEGPTMMVLIGVGIPVSRRPFTYPQVTQLIELATIIESAMERAHFAVKVQHAEQLATVGLLGASLAHEIRNPLVTIKTFVQLLPKHHQDPAFRDKFFALIGDEVTRIDRLTEQLLDLASPRAYQAHPTDLHPILRTSIELVAAKATNKRIEFLTEFQAAPDKVLTDASATKQVLLNLCFNAIQAVETVDGERWIKVATRNVPKGVEMVVADSGPGIAPEIRPRLFQPFQTTKSSGFGLGLAICSDILTGLDATIAVDPSQPGQGATFRIVFPCPV